MTKALRGFFHTYAWRQAAIDAEANKRAELHGTSYEEERRKIMNRYRESAKNARKRRK